MKIPAEVKKLNDDFHESNFILIIEYGSTTEIITGIIIGINIIALTKNSTPKLYLKISNPNFGIGNWTIKYITDIVSNGNLNEYTANLITCDKEFIQEYPICKLPNGNEAIITGKLTIEDPFTI